MPVLDRAISTDQSLLAAYHALRPATVHAVLFLEGIADALSGIATATTIANMQAIKASVSTPGAAVLLSRPVPYVRSPFAEWSKAIGDAMVAAGLVTGPTIPLCGAWPPNADGTVDPLHFDDRGYTQLAAIWRDTLVGMV